jgi:hypothetical protein
MGNRPFKTKSKVDFYESKKKYLDGKILRDDLTFMCSYNTFIVNIKAYIKFLSTNHDSKNETILNDPMFIPYFEKLLQHGENKINKIELLILMHHMTIIQNNRVFTLLVNFDNGLYFDTVQYKYNERIYTHDCLIINIFRQLFSNLRTILEESWIEMDEVLVNLIISMCQKYYKIIKGHFIDCLYLAKIDIGLIKELITKLVHANAINVNDFKTELLEFSGKKKSKVLKDFIISL